MGYRKIIGWAKQIRELLETCAERRSDAKTNQERNRRFLVTAYGFTLGVVGPTSGVSYILLGAVGMGLEAILVGIASWIAFAGLWHGMATRTAARVIIGTFFGLFGVAFWGGGGTISPAFAPIILIPITGGLLGGISSAVRWGGASFVLVVAAVWAETQGILPEPFILGGLHIPGLKPMIACFLLFLMMGGTFAQQVIHRKAETEADEARIVAERANELKSYFLLNISHELLTPLNGVLGITEALEETPFDPNQAELLDGISQSGHRLHRLIEDLLDFAEIQASVAEAKVVEFDPRRLVETVAERYHSVAEAAELRLYCTVGEAPPVLYGDSKRLIRCLSILVDNAIKFTATGHVEVRFAWVEGCARWSVEDTGVGIAEDARADVFDSFQQLEKGTTRKYGGLGLGLAHFASLVELMGGRFGFDSVVGEGSNFWFEMELDSQPPVSLTENELDTALPVNFSRKPRVLVVEDDPINRTTLSLLLRQIGCEAKCVIHGEKALAEVERADYDLVLMDCEMPVMDGYEATVRLRENHAPSQLPIVACTAHGFHSNRLRCLEMGMNDLVTKPISRAQLIRVINTYANTDKKPRRAA